MLAAYTELRLARRVAETGGYVERPRPQPGLSPLWVRRGFRGSCGHWARRPTRRNPADGPRPPQGPPSGPTVAPRRSRRPPRSPGSRPPAQPPRPPDQSSRRLPTTADLGGRPARHARRVKSQAKTGGERLVGWLERFRLLLGCSRHMTSLVDRLLPEELWQRIQPLLPAPPPRPRGGVPPPVFQPGTVSPRSSSWPVPPRRGACCRPRSWAAARPRPAGDAWMSGPVLACLTRCRPCCWMSLVRPASSRPGSVSAWTPSACERYKGRHDTAQTLSIGASKGPSCTWLVSAAGCRSRSC